MTNPNQKKIGQESLPPEGNLCQFPMNPDVSSQNPLETQKKPDSSSPDSPVDLISIRRHKAILRLIQQNPSCLISIRPVDDNKK